MNDLFRREKFARLPRAISKEGKWTHMYEVGEVTYWSAGHAWWRYTLPDRPRRIDVDATRAIFESG